MPPRARAKAVKSEEKVKKPSAKNEKPKKAAAKARKSKTPVKKAPAQAEATPKAKAKARTSGKLTAVVPVAFFKASPMFEAVHFSAADIRAWEAVVLRAREYMANPRGNPHSAVLAAFEAASKQCSMPRGAFYLHVGNLAMKDKRMKQLAMEQLAKLPEYLKHTRSSARHMQGHTYSPVFHFDGLLCLGGQGGIFRGSFEGDSEYEEAAAGRECVAKAHFGRVSVPLAHEARLLARLGEQGVDGIAAPLLPQRTLALTEAGSKDGVAYLYPLLGASMTMVMARDRELLRDRGGGGRLWVMEQVCRTLEQVHAAGVVHLDVHPSNMLLGPWNPKRGEFQRKLHLVDFGLACEVGDGMRCRPGEVGSVLYSSPFILKGKPDPRDDYISLGFVLWRLEHDRVPWDDCSTFAQAEPLKLRFLQEAQYAEDPIVSRLYAGWDFHES